jgi:hypothetical protein
MSINEIKKINDRKLVEESDNKLTECLFSKNPHIIDKSSTTNIIKIDKNKFASVIKPKIIEEKSLKPTSLKPVINLKNKHYDLNDYDYDFEYSDFEYKYK